VPSLDSDEVAKVLLDKMGAKTENKSHKFFYIYDDDGTRVAQTWISHGSRHSIDGSLLTLMARQLRLDVSRNLVKLVDCTLSRDEALAIIKQNK